MKKVWLILGVFLCGLLPAKADEFSFTFQGSTDSGSGIFVTDTAVSYLPYTTTLGYQITSLTGTFDGQAMSIVLSPGIIAPALFYDAGHDLELMPYTGLQFMVNGRSWELCTTDLMVPPGLENAISSNGTIEYVNFTVTPMADPVPEPSTLLLLGAGLTGLLGMTLLKNWL